MTTYIVQKIVERTTSGDTWLLHNEHADGTKTLLGFHRTRKACLLVARIFAGRRKIVVRDKPIRIEAWRVS
jgi:hypothetical protein